MAPDPLGAGILAMLPAEACGLCETARVARYLAEQSAGQCGPCVHGLAAIAGSLEQLVRGDGRTADLTLLHRRLVQIVDRGACRHPDGAAALVSSALRVFAGEVDRHLRRRPCSGHGRPVLPIP